MPGTFSSPAQVIDPDMHHGTCVMHAGIANSQLLLKSVVRKPFPEFQAQPAILRISWEAHGKHKILYGISITNIVYPIFGGQV